jgi:hypothetical protein
MKTISVPASIPWKPHGGHWYRWSEVDSCFRPGVGRRSADVDDNLAKVRYLGGVYLVADTKRSPRQTDASASAIEYIGETGQFKRRMKQFGDSAGFYGKQRNGHSAGWRWPPRGKKNLWICFVPVGNGSPDHLATGLRMWAEAQALEHYRASNGDLPTVNVLLPDAGVGA